MRYLLMSLLFINVAYADTVANYMNIANKIPRMEMKADPQSQAWARSARNVLIITDESIAQSIIAMNNIANDNGQPIFCMPPEVHLDFKTLDSMIRNTYQKLARADEKKANAMTVSQVAITGLTQTYPCQKSVAEQRMERVEKLLGSAHVRRNN